MCPSLRTALESPTSTLVTRLASTPVTGLATALVTRLAAGFGSRLDRPFRGVENRLQEVENRLRRLEHRLLALYAFAERERIRAHLARAEALLRTRAVPSGVDETRRARHLDALREYWRAGRFPANREYQERTPVFRDATGTRCAMGAVVAADGRLDVVDAVADADNAVDLDADDPPAPLAEWVTGSGLALEEAAFVQPAYDPRCVGPLSCAHLRLLLGGAWLIAACWLEYGLYRTIGDQVSARGVRAATFLVGSAVVLFGLAAAAIAAYRMLYVPGWTAYGG